MIASKNNRSLRRKRALTLIEIIIVMIIITSFIAVMAYNYQGSLEKGKAFKTEQGMEKVRTILALKLAEDPDAAAGISTKWRDYLKESPLVRDPDDLARDGWGVYYEVTLDSDSRTGESTIVIHSQQYDNYRRRIGKK